MGAQCSCSKSKPSSQHQIKHEEETQAATPTYNDKFQQEVQFIQDNNKQTVCEGGQKKQHLNKQNKENQIVEASAKQEVELKIQKLQNKKQKKRVQVMIPTKQLEESNDSVTFIDKQISKDVLNFIVKTLKTHFILSQLSPEEAHYVVTKMRYCTAQKGNYIFKQGDPSFSYYIILEGKCKVEINKQSKKTMEKGSSFGDLGIIYNAPRSASIFAETECLFAELNSKTFKKIINDLNSIYQRQNKKMFEHLQFFKQLNDLQKNVLASNCVTQIYQPGQVIFNKGDDANAFYVIQQGIVTILQKKIDLKTGQNVGINVIMSSASAVRSNTLIAKTYCKLLSLTRQIIFKNLGDNVSNILQKNLISKILKQSDIWEMYSPQQWADVVQKSKITKYGRGDIVFQKNSKSQLFQLYVLLSSDARSLCNPKTSFYLANSIVQSNRIFKKMEIQFDDDFKASNEGYLAKIFLPKEKASSQTNQVISNALLNSFINFKKIKQLNNPVQTPKESLSMKDFIVLRKLRSGNFGRVYACYNKVTAKKYAIKVMNKQSLISSNVMSYIMKEEQLLRTLPQHPFLVKYSTMFRDANFVMLVMELLQGQDLFDATNEKLPLNESNCRFLISQVILVLEHLHKNKVIYRDLKPQNIILKLDGYLTMVDMGTAKKLTMENRFKTMTIIGTPHYMAPQIILGKGYTFSADWWSMGVMLYQMACGKLPYGEFLQDPFSVYQQVLKGQLSFTSGCNTSTKEVITKLLNKNMQKRLKNGCTELKQMQFFKDIKWEKVMNKEYEPNIFPPKSSGISSEQIQRILEKKTPLAIQVFIKDRDKQS